MSESRIFNVAVKLSPERRAAYLDQACGTNQVLRGEVESLLLANEDACGFLQSHPGRPPATVDEGPLTERPGTLIGPYKLLQQIGEGGMGVVYMAEQQEPVRRMVALKIIKPGMDSAQVIARFEAERQALALMDYPNIAKVLDAGTTESGRPYFVMELVKGIPITRFCDENQLTPHQRLELFLPVCQAVQHAHQMGIIHRDLKPSNVLVALYDDRPVPKVIDFGVAKATSQKLTERTLFTGFGSFVGTLEYMSPEQAKLNALDIDTRSDVYALGVLLYELLTGNTPLEHERLKQTALDELLRTIREEEPPKPSTRLSQSGEALVTISAKRGTEPAKLGQVLRGELDWIVMKALEKDRTRRYETANGLARDVERYLHDEPVEACPPTVSYKLRKFARKHKAGLASAAGFAALLVLGTAVSAWQAVRATQAETVALAERDDKERARQAEAEQRDVAVLNEQIAQQQRDEAERQREEVRALNEKLQATQAELRRTLYAAQMNLARHAWEEDDVSRVQELLDQQRPKPGEPDLRGFEWNYLQRLCHSELLSLKGHTGEVRSLAYSPDGTRLASASTTWDSTKKAYVAGEAKVWDAQTGQVLLTIQGHADSLVFGPDGKRLIGGGRDGKVTVWNAQTGQEISSIKGDLYVVGAFSPDGKRLAGWFYNVGDEVKVCDAQTGQKLLTLRHASYIPSVAFSPDSKRLATASRDNTVKLWDAQTGQELLSLKGDFDIVAFSPDGKRLAGGDLGGTMKVWDAQTGQELLSLKDSNGTSSMAFSPDGKRLVNASPRGTLRIWDLQTGQAIRTLKSGGRIAAGFSPVTFSPDGQRLANISADHTTVKVWDAQNDQESLTLPAGSEGGVVAFSPDWRRLASAASDNTVEIRDAQTGQPTLRLKGHTAPVWSLAFSPDGKCLASGAGGHRFAGGASGNNGTTDRAEVKVWDTQTGHELFTLPVSLGFVRSVAFSPDGKRLAGASANPPNLDPKSSTLKVWDAQTGQELLSFPGGGWSVAFSPDGKRLASSGGGGPRRPGQDQVRVWDMQTGQELLSLPGRGGWGMAFSPDGKRLASSFRDQTLKVWDVQTRQELLTCKGASSGVAFSPDGKRLTSGGKVWDAQTGQELLALKGRTALVQTTAFSPDGHRLAGASFNGTVTIWDATPLPKKP
jgi:WD40 repeat protein/serine/threonine protein kinase